MHIFYKESIITTYTGQKLPLDVDAVPVLVFYSKFETIVEDSVRSVDEKLSKIYQDQMGRVIAITDKQETTPEF